MLQDYATMGLPTRAQLESAFAAAVAAADPFDAVSRALTHIDGVVSVGGSVVGAFRPDQITIVGIGKAAPAMADAVAAATGSTAGLVVSPYEAPCTVRLVRGGHPVPNQESLDAGLAVKEVVSGVVDDGLIIAVISGGGSAAAEVLAESVTLDELVDLNAAMLGSGMPIEDINQVRAAMSLMKAGGVYEWAGSTKVVSLVLSDIAGGGAEFVSSGPTIPSDLGSGAQKVVDRWGLTDQIPDSVHTAIGGFERSPARFEVVVETVGSPARAADAAAEDLRREGFDVQIVTSELVGEAHTRAVELLTASAPGIVWIAAGEPTVTLQGTGLGGRSQEAALAAVPALALSGGVFAALGTDGIDGPTDAAGAIVDGATAVEIARKGWDAAAELASNNSNPVLKDVGCLVITGPTGTNVCDVWMWAKPAAR
jgi:hydroxypyruvate reductase